MRAYVIMVTPEAHMSQVSQEGYSSLEKAQAFVEKRSGNLQKLSEYRYQYDDPQICATCACHRFDWDAEDFVCTNDRSERFGDWTKWNDICWKWKEKKHRERKK